MVVTLAGFSDETRTLTLTVGSAFDLPITLALAGLDSAVSVTAEANYATSGQYSATGLSNYHGLHVSFIQRPTAWGSYRVSYALSKAMNNLGEFFFSSPIDPFEVSKDWGRSDSDQRHRLTINGSVNTSAEPATTMWERLAHGFQLSGMVQAYSAVPFNITSGVTTVQGTAGRPIVNGEFIERNAGVGDDFLSLNLRISRSVRLRSGGSSSHLLSRLPRLWVPGCQGGHPRCPLARHARVPELVQSTVDAAIADHPVHNGPGKIRIDDNRRVVQC